MKKHNQRERAQKKQYFDNRHERYFWFTALFLVLAIAFIGIATDSVGALQLKRPLDPVAIENKNPRLARSVVKK